MSKVEIKIPAMMKLIQDNYGDLIVDDDSILMDRYAEYFITEYIKANTVDTQCEVLIAWIKAMYPDEEGAIEHTEVLWFGSDGRYYNTLPHFVDVLYDYDNKVGPEEYVTIKNHGFQDLLGMHADDHISTIIAYYETALEQLA